MFYSLNGFTFAFDVIECSFGILFDFVYLFFKYGKVMFKTDLKKNAEVVSCSRA